jgi:hypothetical protein
MKTHDRFNRWIVAFVLFALLAASYAVFLLLVAPPEYDPHLATESSVVLLSHQARKAGAATAPAPEAMDPIRHVKQP